MKIEYLKVIAIIIAISAITWFIKDYEDKKDFKANTEANEEWQNKFDSLRIKNLIFTEKQLINAIKQDNKLKEIIKENNIKLSKIESVLKYSLKYRDTTIVKTDLSEVLLAINEKRDLAIPFIDSTDCLVNKGLIEYNNGEINLVFTDRIFLGETTAVGHLVKKQWKFWFIKSRLFGKKQMTAVVKDKCGQSQIININKSE